MTTDRDGKNVVYIVHKIEFFKALPAGTLVKKFGVSYKKVHNMKNFIIGQSIVSKTRTRLDVEELTCASYEAYLKIMNAYEDLIPF